MRISNLERATMRFSRHRHSYGIVVYAEFEDTYGVSRWHPVRNFGDNQSEAYYFMRHAYELSEPRLRLLAESFDPEVVVVNGDRKFGEFKKSGERRCRNSPRESARAAFCHSMDKPKKRYNT